MRYFSVGLLLSALVLAQVADHGVQAAYRQVPGKKCRPKHHPNKDTTNTHSNDFLGRKGPNGEYMGVPRPQEVKPEVMRTVPVPRKDFAPQAQIKASYMTSLPPEKNPLGAPAMVVADCQYKTKRPTVNLDNFLQIQSIRCEGNRVTIAFDDDASAATARNEWSKETASQLVVMFGPEWKCNGVNMREVTSIQPVARNATAGRHASLIELDTKELEREDVIDEFDLTIKQYDDHRALQRRSFWNWDKRSSKSLNLSVNYDRNKKLVIRPDIPIIDTPTGSVSCIDCYATGEASVAIRVTGSTIRIKSYDVQLSGEVKANMDLKFQLAKSARRDLTRVSLWVLPLGAVSVPDVFTFIPEMRLFGAVQYECTEAAVIKTGFDFSLPMSWGISSSNGLFSRPTVRKSFKPTLQTHAYHNATDLLWSTRSLLIPEISLQFSIMALTFEFALGMDNEMGVQIRSGKYLPECLDKSSLLFYAYHAHNCYLHFKTPVSNNRFQVWYSGQLALPCPGDKCERCREPPTLPDQVQKNTTTTTTVPSNSTATSTPAADQTSTSLTQSETQVTKTTRSATLTMTSSTAPNTTTAAGDDGSKTHATTPIQTHVTAEPTSGISPPRTTTTANTATATATTTRNGSSDQPAPTTGSGSDTSSVFLPTDSTTSAFRPVVPTTLSSTKSEPKATPQPQPQPQPQPEPEPQQPTQPEPPAYGRRPPAYGRVPGSGFVHVA